MSVDPKTVTSPLNRWEEPQIIYDGGAEDSGGQGFSIAVGRWDGSIALGIRWNGRAGTNGFPVGRNYHPLWMIIPDPLRNLILSSDIIEPKKRILALQCLDEQE